MFPSPALENLESVAFTGIKPKPAQASGRAEVQRLSPSA